MSGFQDLVDLLLPSKCVLCSSSGSSLCKICSIGFLLDPRPTSRNGLVGYSSCSYGPVASKLLTAFKEQNQTSLAGFFADRMIEVCLEGFSANPVLAGGGEFRSRSTPLNSFGRRTLLVPVPSSKANFIKRGYSPAMVLAKSMRRGLAKDGEGAFAMVNALVFDRVVADQSRLGSRARHENLSGAMKSSSRVNGHSVILVDDIVTTGATILEAARAVRQEGGQVLGFVTFSETLLKTQAKN